MSNSAAAPATGRKGPLSGFRVLTVDNYFAGNYGPLLLAFHGAEVVKIEQPGSGDPLRTDPPYLDAKAKALSHGELRLMRGKSSVALDIRKPAGKEVLRKLIGSADVFWTNLRPAAAKRLGIEPEAVQGINPRIVYASVSGFGLPGAQTLPFQDEPAFDIIIQALTGLMSRNADADGTPHYRGDPAARVDVSMFDAMLALNEKTFSLCSMDGIVRPPRISATNAPFGAYRGKDGFIVIGVGGHVLWERFCRALGREDLLARDDLNTGMKRVQHEKSVLRPLIEEWLRARTVKEASRILLEHDVPASPILDVDSPVLREQVSTRGLTRNVTAPDGRPVTLVQSPVRLSSESTEDFGLPRGLGADTNRVLTQWIGMSESQIAVLRNEGIAA
jgi:CoA:oxalate CoA-transferase